MNSLTSKTVSTDFGDINVSYDNYVAETTDLTSEISIEFNFGEVSKEYKLERSVFFNE